MTDDNAYYSCHWRMAESEAPCVHCLKPTRGRSTGGVVVCGPCWHNVPPSFQDCTRIYHGQKYIPGQQVSVRH